MAALPDADEMAASFLTQYDVYYKRLDPEATGVIGAMDAATFLKQSGIPDDVLGKIWDLSDVGAKGSLDRQGFFAACKFVALHQDRQDVMICNLLNESPAPFFGQATAPGAPTAKPAGAAGAGGKTSTVQFLVKPEEKRKYDALFDQLKPVDGKLPGDKVRQVMVGSKQPMPVLGQIWDLSDIDRDGLLDRYEFTVAMHLLFRAVQGDKVPPTLPEELSMEKVPKSLTPAPAIGPTKQDQEAGVGGPVVEAVPWVVNAGEKLRYQNLFKQTDKDKDGFVSGIEIKNVFLQTGLPQNILAHIWNLCDIKQEGKLNPEQFALAMWLIARKQSGKDPPAALTPDMVPPSMRAKMTEGSGMGSIYNNPELEMVAKEIQTILMERLQIEKQMQDSEYNLSVQKTQVQSLQTEFDTLAATLKQLTNQRDVAQKRLDDLDVQIEKLRTQADEQEKTLTEQEEEVHGKKREYEKLKDEEKEISGEIRSSEANIRKLIEDVALISELEEETREQLEMLQEAEKHMEEALKAFASSNDDCSNVPEPFLEPVRMAFSLPDYSRLDKPKRPPAPPMAAQQDSVMNGSTNSWDDGQGYDQQQEQQPAGGQSQQEVNWGQNDAFASFDERSGDENEKGPTPLPRPDSSGGSYGESPTPALPPKSDGAAGAPRRPPPPKRPPPPGAGGPSRPPPPKSGEGSPDGDDPFGSAANKGDGGFADFSNFQASFDSQPSKNSAFTDSAFSSPSHQLQQQLNSNSQKSQQQTSSAFGLQKSATDASVFASAFSAFPGDSAFSSKSATPSHHKSTLDFAEDPFKSSEHRYGDPFEISAGASSGNGGNSGGGFDPFGAETQDPFTAPVTAAFGASTTNLSKGFDDDPFAPSAPSSTTTSNDPFSPFKNNSRMGGGAPSSIVQTDSDDPFSLILSNSLKKPTESSKTSNLDPFGSSKANADPFGSSANDPFASFSSVSSSSKPTATKDDWFTGFPQPTSGSSSSKQRQPPKVDGKPAKLTASKTGGAASKSLATNWGSSGGALGGGDDPFSKVPKLPKGSKSSSSKPKKSKSGVLSDFLNNPLKQHSTSNEGGSGSTLKKKHKWVPKLVSGGGGSSNNDNSGATPTPTSGASAAKMDNLQMKMATDASRRAEQERMRRLRLQEEQDLAYAIALSKAEAESAKVGEK